MIRRNLAQLWAYFVLYPISGALGWFLLTPPYNLYLAISCYIASGVFVLLVMKDVRYGR